MIKMIFEDQIFLCLSLINTENIYLENKKYTNIITITTKDIPVVVITVLKSK